MTAHSNKQELGNLLRMLSAHSGEVYGPSTTPVNLTGYAGEKTNFDNALSTLVQWVVQLLRRRTLPSMYLRPLRRTGHWVPSP